MKFDILNITVQTLKIGERFFKRNKPRIFMIGGIGLSAAGTVTACAATYKHIDNILDKCKNDLEAAGELPEDEAGKEKAKAIASAAASVVKTYAVPAALSAAGFGSIIYANHIQEQRQEVLSSALTSVGAAYAAYKKRVEETYGKDANEAILTNSKPVEVTTDDGKEVKKETVETAEKDDLLDSPFDKFFDESSRCWKDDAEENNSFLFLAEKECDRQLKREGYLLLSDVYRKLDIPITKASLVAGWVYNSEYGDEISDDYVSFGLKDIHDQAKRRFINGYENVVLLSFNCSSNIADYI